ncbi:TPA: flagellar biosynthetic protein FliO [Candidatus Latescibacteria bacterium]|nr:flagellar biosynthetic protein FliO [Candidatus Latescibacterota bacterium]
MNIYLSLITAILLGWTGTLEATTEANAPDSLMADVPAQTATAEAGSAVMTASTVLPTGNSLPDTTGMVTRMGLSLLVVIGLIWGAVQVLKKLSPGSTGGRNSGQIRVLDRAYIAPKKSIYVVQIGCKAMALGVSDQQITNLTDLDLEETLERYAEQQESRVSQRFTDVLKTVNARFARHTEEAAT